MRQFLFSNSSIFFLFVFLLVNLQIQAREYAEVSFEKADSIAVNFTETYNSSEELAKKLTAELETRIEKARVFYMWIAHNVRYDCKKFQNLKIRKKQIQIKADTKEELLEKKKDFEEKQLQKTLKTKQGICEDYSRLYKAMADAVGLEAVVIIGDSRDFNQPYRSYHNNPHAWNAVKIDDKWHLLDATWAAGNTNPEVTKFYRKVRTGYFFTPPHLFAQNHFPDDEKWQLLETPLTREDFSTQTLINYASMKYHITDFAPSAIEDADKNDRKRKKIWFQFEKAPKAIGVSTKKGKKIDFDKIEGKDGKVILSIDAPFSRSVTIYGGDSYRGELEWLAIYEL